MPKTFLINPTLTKILVFSIYYNMFIRKASPHIYAFNCMIDKMRNNSNSKQTDYIGGRQKILSVILHCNILWLSRRENGSTVKIRRKQSLSVSNCRWVAHKAVELRRATSPSWLPLICQQNFYLKQALVEGNRRLRQTLSKNFAKIKQTDQLLITILENNILCCRLIYLNTNV